MNHLACFVQIAVAVSLAAAPMHPARAGNSASSFGVEFSDCVESIGVGLAPTAAVVALTPPNFIPVGLGTPVSPIVVRTSDCAGIAVDGNKPKAGSVVQIGAVIVPPESGVGDINNYTFWYYTTDAKLAHRLQDLGVSAQHVAPTRYDLDPEELGMPDDLTVVVPRPGNPTLVLSGTVIPSGAPTGSFEAIWWQQTVAGNIRMATNVPVIAISSANLTLATDPANALGGLIGGSTLGFPIIQQFNMFSAAQMGVSTTP
jgi:hypothetical protein